MSLVTTTVFAHQIGVSQRAVSKAIKVGRVPVYDEAGQPVAASYAGRKFVKPDEAGTAFRLSRARIDDAALAEAAAELDRELDVDPERVSAIDAPSGALQGTLAQAKTQKEKLQAELLEMRLARERGELLSRAAQVDAFEIAGGKIARMIGGMQFWAEDLNSLAHKGGVPAISAWLREKSTDILTRLADVLTATTDDADADDDTEPALP